jgi:hypothetical protein
MAELDLSLSDLFAEAFGYRTEAAVPEFKGRRGFGNALTVPSRTEDGKHGSPYYAKDAVGREYYLPVEIQVGNDVIPGTNTTYAEKWGVRSADGATTGRWNLPYPIISVTGDKRIIETDLTERRGTVKELINTRDWVISVKGFLINNENEFPEDDFETLVKLYELNIPVRINNVLTDILLLNPERDGSDLVVIRKLTFPEVRGVKHVKPYEIEFVSDEAFNLIEIV